MEGENGRKSVMIVFLILVPQVRFLPGAPIKTRGCRVSLCNPFLHCGQFVLPLSSLSPIVSVLSIRRRTIQNRNVAPASAWFWCRSPIEDCLHLYLQIEFESIDIKLELIWRVFCGSRLRCRF